MTHKQIIPCLHHYEPPWETVPHGCPSAVHTAPPNNWSITRNKQDVGNGTNATGADTDRTAQLRRGRTVCEEDGMVSTHGELWPVLLTENKAMKKEMTININKLVKCNERVNTIHKTWGKIHVSSREGLKPTHPL